MDRDVHGEGHARGRRHRLARRSEPAPRAFVLLDHRTTSTGDVNDAKTWGKKSGIDSLDCSRGLPGALRGSRLSPSRERSTRCPGATGDRDMRAALTLTASQRWPRLDSSPAPHRVSLRRRPGGVAETRWWALESHGHACDLAEARTRLPDDEGDHRGGRDGEASRVLRARLPAGSSFVHRRSDVFWDWYTDWRTAGGRLWIGAVPGLAAG